MPNPSRSSKGSGVGVSGSLMTGWDVKVPLREIRVDVTPQDGTFGVGTAGDTTSSGCRSGKA